MKTRFVHSRSRVLAMALAALITAAGVGWYVEKRDDALPAHAVLRIDDTVVNEDELDDRLRVLGALYGVERPSGGDKEDQFKRDAAKSLTVSMILDRAADEQGIVIADNTARQALDKAIDQQTLGRDGFVSFLGESGLSERDVLEEIRRQLATNRLVEEITSDVEPVTADEVRAAYHADRASMVSAERRRLRNIVVGTRREALRVLRQARAGTPFASLAVAWSRDSSTRARGGDLGAVAEEQLEPEYAEAAFAVRPGTLFGPVRTRFGWNVGIVVDVMSSTPLSFSQVEKQLRVELQNRRMLERWRSWLADELADADVEYADDYLPDDPDAPPSELRSDSPWSP